MIYEWQQCVSAKWKLRASMPFAHVKVIPASIPEGLQGADSSPDLFWTSSVSN